MQSQKFMVVEKNYRRAQMLFLQNQQEWKGIEDIRLHKSTVAKCNVISFMVRRWKGVKNLFKKWERLPKSINIFLQAFIFLKMLLCVKRPQDYELSKHYQSH